MQIGDLHIEIVRNVLAHNKGRPRVRPPLGVSGWCTVYLIITGRLLMPVAVIMRSE